ncbi:hypothetical protein [Mycolicibacterium sphagni]|uniref:hypothetical protein n=1 Tax=Mycolicibacterium sphagni TaxID=1786 RepID=UPI0021F292F0|nr:hypothetical protein [Mycolicibacterium sphagni]MCV7174761.1 hypothetical protein [Mycolicibacterium sphagni]
MTFGYESDAHTEALFAEIGGRWDDRRVEYHSPDQEFVYPGRKVAVIPGVVHPYTPEGCTAEENMWILDGRLLLCTGCGLDGT